MHALRIALDKRRYVVHHLLQAGETNHLERVARAHIGQEIDCGGFDRRVLPALHELVTAFRFALEGKPRWKHPDKFARNVEQLRNVSAL